MQRPPETIKRVIIADKQSKSFHIALSVLKNTFNKDFITKALIDSGASINCLDWGFVKRNKIPYNRLPQPIRAKNIDGSDNESGIIKFITTTFIRIKGIIHRVLFHIINCGNENVILGTPGWRKSTLKSTGLNKWSTSWIIQTELQTTIKRTRLYKETQQLPRPTPTSSPRSTSGKNLSMPTKTSSTTSKEKTQHHPPTNSRSWVENSSLQNHHCH